MSGALHEQRLDRPCAALVDRKTVTYVDHLVVGAVNHEHRSSDFRYFVDGRKRVEEPGSLRLLVWWREQAKLEFEFDGVRFGSVVSQCNSNTYRENSEATHQRTV